MHILQFISSFANTAKLLTKLIKEKQAFQWTPEVEAFQTLKEALSTVPILAYLQPRDRFFVSQTCLMSGLEECCHKYRLDRSM
jgi:hypothetical protein